MVKSQNHKINSMKNSHSQKIKKLNRKHTIYVKSQKEKHQNEKKLLTGHSFFK